MGTKEDSELLGEIRKRLTPARFYHSLNVAHEAKKLAARWGADEERAFTAGLAHDITKDTDKDTQRRLIEEDGGTLSPTELASPKTWHQRSGEVFLRRKLHITDGQVLSAVRWHTTGRADMSLLEKVVYMADYVSADRRYPGVEALREKAYLDLKAAMLEGLQHTVVKNVQKGLPIHEDSIAAYNSLVIS